MHQQRMIHRSESGNGAPSCRAFTLPELMIGITVSGFVMVSLGSALTIATRSIRPDSSSSVTLDAARGLKLLQEDIRFSTQVLDHSPTSIRLVTTDANEDGNQDVVQYAWSEISGDDLLRSVDGGPAVSICDDITDFNIGLATRDSATAIPSPSIAGSEQLLDDFASTGTSTQKTVNEGEAYAQFIHPSRFPASATPGSGDEWQITRIEYFASKTAFFFSGEYQVDVLKATEDGLPSHETLYSVQMDSRDASSSGSWLSVAMDGLPWLDSTEGVTVTFSHLNGYNCLALRMAEASSANGYLTTDSSESEWLRPATNRSLLFRVYGRIRSRTHLDQQEPARRFQMASIRLAATSLSEGPLHAAAEFLNKPLDATLFADTDFSANSITSDSNRDGLADWALTVTGSPNSSTVASGKWTVKNEAIRLTPSIAAGQPVDIQVCCRSALTSGRVIIRSAVPQLTGGQSISALAYLTLQSDGTQTLAVYEETGTNTFVRRSQYPMLSSSLQTVRLVLNPQSKSLAVWVNGVFLESLNAGLITAPSLPSTVQVQAYGDTCEFDSCTVLTRSVASTEIILP